MEKLIKLIEFIGFERNYKTDRIFYKFGFVIDHLYYELIIMNNNISIYSEYNTIHLFVVMNKITDKYHTFSNTKDPERIINFINNEPELKKILRNKKLDLLKN